MHLLRSYHLYIFPTTPTTIRTSPPYLTAHPILPSTHTTIHNHHHHHIYTTVTSLFTIFKWLHHKTQHPTLQPTQTFTGTLATPIKIHFTPRIPHSQAQTKQSNSSQYQPPYNTLNKVDNTQPILYQHTHTDLPYKEPAHTNTLKTSSHSTTKHNQSPYTNMSPPSMTH